VNIPSARSSSTTPTTTPRRHPLPTRRSATPAKAKNPGRTRPSLCARHPADRRPDRHQRTPGPGPRRTAHRHRACDSRGHRRGSSPGAPSRLTPATRTASPSPADRAKRVRCSSGWDARATIEAGP
jgi:hypothetical protein